MERETEMQDMQQGKASNISGESETLNDGLMPLWGSDPFPEPYKPVSPMGWKEWSILAGFVVAWYAGWSIGCHSVLGGLLAGTGSAMLLGISAVFFSGEWIK